MSNTAEAALERCLERLKARPDDLSLQLEGASLCLQLEIPEAAVEFCRKVIRIQPRLPIAHFTLGRALGDQGNWTGALAAFTKAQSLDPMNLATQARIAQALLLLGRENEARKRIQTLLGTEQLTQGTLELLGDLLRILKDPIGAEAAYKRALAQGENALTRTALGALYTERKEASAGLAQYQRAFELEPDSPTILYNLGVALVANGDVEAGGPLLKQALALKPGKRDYVTGNLFSINSDPTFSPEEVHRLAQNGMDGAYPEQRLVFEGERDRDPDRKLRIGYLSADFRNHAMAHWTAPLLEARDPAQFEVFCFYENSHRDTTTQRFKSLSDRWFHTHGMSAEEVAAKIQSLRIDILVDLAGHTNGNRLDALALKPAPIQVLMLGFDRTSGLRSMDWRISNALADPPGEADKYSTERIWRLNGPFCYEPLAEAPEVAPLPALERGHLTFGFLGNHARIGRPFLEASARLLAELPEARLVLLCRDGEDEAHKDFKRAFFRQAGVSEDRLLFKPRLSPEAAFLAYYNEVDITLNSFPAEGGTTICESLWMGVPVLALDRPNALRHTARGILTHMGLEDWLTEDLESWLAMAKTWSGRHSGLAELRSSLRPRMAASSLCDARSAVARIEAAYRGMWREWCTLKA